MYTITISARELLERTISDLKFLGRDPARIPMVFQLNKRDLPAAEPVARLKQLFQWQIADHVEIIAPKDIGTVRL